jgi:hypothetical protein
MGIITLNKNATRELELGDGLYLISLTLETESLVWDTFEDNFSVYFPRSYIEDETVRFYVTPNDPSIKSCANSLENDTNSIYSWVCGGVKI